MAEETEHDKEFSTSQIAKALDVSTRTIYRWIEDGEIEYSRTATGRYRFPESELRKILEEKKKRGLDRIPEVILKTVKKKKIVYLRELQITLEDVFLHEYVKDECVELVRSDKLNTRRFDGNRWFFPKNVRWGQVESLANHKIELMNAYIDHPRKFERRGVIYDDYGEMLVEDALIKTGYVVVSKNSHYFNGKEYHQDEPRARGRKRDLDYIAFERSKNAYIGIQVKNRLEYPRMDDVHLLLDICNTLDLFPVLVTRLSHPRIYAIFQGIKGEVMQTKRYFLQPPFPRDRFEQISAELRIPLGVYQWVPNFLLRNFERLKGKL